MFVKYKPNLMKTNRILSFILCILLMCATALCVNKALFSHSFKQTEATTIAVATDTISSLPDGTKVIHTALLTKEPGYAGPVPLDVYITKDTISDIQALPNAETPSFFSRASAMFSQWIGKTTAQAATMQADGVSGATYSSNAIKANVNSAIDFYAKTSVGSRTDIPFKIWIAIAVTLAACVIPLFVKNKFYRYTQMIANIIVLGFWCGQFLDYSLMLRYLSDGFTFPGAIVAILMLIAAFIYPLFGKAQHYCNHICPLGSAQMLVAEICHYKIHVGPKVLKALEWFRKILWGVLMLVLWADIWTGWMDLELFQAFMIESAPTGIIIAAAVFVILSAVISRPYCRFVCPTGSLFKRSENIG